MTRDCMLPDGYPKRSFLRFDVGIDAGRLADEFRSIPDEAWASSYWGNIHCSVGMLLLRGGDTGTQEDFYSEEVHDNPLLQSLPHMRHLMAEDGPFGGAKYGFIFRMRPNGVTRLHQDTMDQWQDKYRIHVPILTNPDALLISDGKAIHFAAGYAWNFDNMTSHGVVNGNEERVHLIMDVPFNPAMKQRYDEADYLPGEDRPDLVEKVSSRETIAPSYFGDKMIRNGIRNLRSRGLDDEKIVEVFNAKQVPTKRYYENRWTLEMLREVDAGG